MKGTIFHAYIISYISLAITVVAFIVRSANSRSMHLIKNPAIATRHGVFLYRFARWALFWLLSPNPFTALSYMLGAILGTAYTYGLGKFVESIGGSAYDAEDVKGSGVGSARFAFLIVLFIFVGKFRSEGLQEIPSIMGFFTYQISTLSQGLKDANSDDLY
jgi:hypothetical protein